MDLASNTNTTITLPTLTKKAGKIGEIIAEMSQSEHRRIGEIK